MPDSIAAGDVLIVVEDKPNKAQVSVLDDTTVTLESFERSSNKYTACPVVKDFTAYTINGERWGERELRACNLLAI